MYTPVLFPQDIRPAREIGVLASTGFKSASPLLYGPFSVTKATFMDLRAQAPATSVPTDGDSIKAADATGSRPVPAKKSVKHRRLLKVVVALGLISGGTAMVVTAPPGSKEYTTNNCAGNYCLQQTHPGDVSSQKAFGLIIAILGGATFLL